MSLPRKCVCPPCPPGCPPCATPCACDEFDPWRLGIEAPGTPAQSAATAVERGPGSAPGPGPEPIVVGGRILVAGGPVLVAGESITEFEDRVRPGAARGTRVAPAARFPWEFATPSLMGASPYRTLVGGGIDDPPGPPPAQGGRLADALFLGAGGGGPGLLARGADAPPGMPQGLATHAIRPLARAEREPPPVDPHLRGSDAESRQIGSKIATRDDLPVTRAMPSGGPKAAAADARAIAARFEPDTSRAALDAARDRLRREGAISPEASDLAFVQALSGAKSADLRTRNADPLADGPWNSAGAKGAEAMVGASKAAHDRLTTSRLEEYRGREDAKAMAARLRHAVAPAGAATAPAAGPVASDFGLGGGAPGASAPPTKPPTPSAADFGLGGTPNAAPLPPGQPSGGSPSAPASDSPSEMPPTVELTPWTPLGRGAPRADDLSARAVRSLDATTESYTSAGVLEPTAPPARPTRSDDVLSPWGPRLAADSAARSDGLLVVIDPATRTEVLAPPPRVRRAEPRGPWSRGHARARDGRRPSAGAEDFAPDLRPPAIGPHDGPMVPRLAGVRAAHGVPDFLPDLRPPALPPHDAPFVPAREIAGFSAPDLAPRSVRRSPREDQAAAAGIPAPETQRGRSPQPKGGPHRASEAGSPENPRVARRFGGLATPWSPDLEPMVPGASGSDGTIVPGHAADSIDDFAEAILAAQGGLPAPSVPGARAARPADPAGGAAERLLGRGPSVLDAARDVPRGKPGGDRLAQSAAALAGSQVDRALSPRTGRLDLNALRGRGSFFAISHEIRGLQQVAVAAGPSAQARFRRDVLRLLAASIYEKQRSAWKARGKTPPRPSRRNAEKDAAALLDELLSPTEVPPDSRPGVGGGTDCPCPCRPASKGGGDSGPGSADPATRGTLAHTLADGPALGPSLLASPAASVPGPHVVRTPDARWPHAIDLSVQTPRGGVALDPTQPPFVIRPGEEPQPGLTGRVRTDLLWSPRGGKAPAPAGAPPDPVGESVGTTRTPESDGPARRRSERRIRRMLRDLMDLYRRRHGRHASPEELGAVRDRLETWLRVLEGATSTALDRELVLATMDRTGRLLGRTAIELQRDESWFLAAYAQFEIEAVLDGPNSLASGARIMELLASARSLDRRRIALSLGDREIRDDAREASGLRVWEFTVAHSEAVTRYVHTVEAYAGLHTRTHPFGPWSPEPARQVGDNLRLSFEIGNPRIADELQYVHLIRRQLDTREQSLFDPMGLRESWGEATGWQRAVLVGSTILTGITAGLGAVATRGASTSVAHAISVGGLSAGISSALLAAGGQLVRASRPQDVRLDFDDILDAAFSGVVLGAVFGAVSGASLPGGGPRAGVPAPEAALPQITRNKIAGDAFRDEIAGLMKSAGRDVRTEVYKRTPFGKRFIDIDVRLDGRNLGGIETKLVGARYTPIQRAKDAWLRIVEDYPVNVVRPGQ